MKKKVAIILRPDKNMTNKDIFEIYDSIRKIVISYNCIPIAIIPNVLNIESKLNALETEELITQISICDGMICQGGDSYYDYDKVIAKYAVDYNIPIFGICLGCQLLATINNQSESLVCMEESLVPNHKITTHMIKILPNSKLYQIIGKEQILVNSFHVEKIINSGIFTPNAFSEDGIIEGLEYNKNIFALGVQWHPEKDIDDENNKKLFDAFFESIKNRA